MVDFLVRFLAVVMIDSHTCSIHMITDQLHRCFAGILYECVILKRCIRQNTMVCKSVICCVIGYSRVSVIFF